MEQIINTTYPACGVSRSEPTGDFNIAFNQWVSETLWNRALFDLHDPANPILTEANRAAFRQDQIPHYEQHLFFVTVHFTLGRFSARDEWSGYQDKRLFDLFRKWYLTTCRWMLGDHFAGKKPQQPFTMAFLDVEGSRNGRPGRALQLPHLHALMLVRPSQLEHFQLHRRQGRFKASPGSELDKVDIRQFKDQDFGAEPMMTYAAKFARTAIRNSRFDLGFWSYPDGLVVPPVLLN
jgi:hypothetical protein